MLSRLSSISFRLFAFRRLQSSICHLQFAIPALLALLLYSRALTLPFYWDDVANFIWMEHRPLSSIWVDSSGFPFYRPLGFTIWRGMQIV
ncbi:MAG: hypothetical protein HY260_22890, partial [Chloroflexi bacterium]|nr:hypothetical protein [Chloroflexota bacterium]